MMISTSVTICVIHLCNYCNLSMFSHTASPAVVEKRVRCSAFEACNGDIWAYHSRPIATLLQSVKKCKNSENPCEDLIKVWQKNFGVFWLTICSLQVYKKPIVLWVNNTRINSYYRFFFDQPSRDFSDYSVLFSVKCLASLLPKVNPNDCHGAPIIQT